MNCKWCNKELTENQVYDFLRGKQVRMCCSKACSMKIFYYNKKENEPIRIKEKIAYNHNCIKCGKDFINSVKNQKHCSTKCSAYISSERMINNNPMKNLETRNKVRNTLINMKHKPIIQGGNGKGATIHQLNLYNELIKYNNSFEMELIELTKPYTDEFKAPNHYKIDIASRIYKLAIEVDGVSHNSLKVKECDNRKDKLLSLKGWKVLRLSNLQIESELNNCVQAVLSMI